MSKIFATMALVAAALPVVPVHADDMALKHEASQLSVPQILGGQPLISSKALYKGDLEHSWGFNSPDEKEILTVFVFRKASGNNALWFDRAQAAVETNVKLGSKTALYAPRAFVPDGQANPSAMRVVYDLSGGYHKSSGVVLIPMGKWFVKLRATSASRSAPELDGWIDKILASIDLPSPAKPEPDATTVQPCSSTLKFAKNAKAIRQTSSNALAGGLLGAIVAGRVAEDSTDEDAGREEDVPNWCRDNHAIAPSAVYRANAATDNYLIALGDSGQAVSVGRDELGALLTGSKKAQYSVQLIMPDKILVFAPRNGMPTPEKALEIANAEVPISSTSTGVTKASRLNCHPTPDERILRPFFRSHSAKGGALNFRAPPTARIQL